MINQTRAVKVVSDALRRARSGVNNPNRPIGTFMFMGPTGVGKTELAKAIASTFFGGEENIVRVDMNEYISAESANRLIEPSDSGGTGLIPQIRRQPFSVVLFDEIEKADPKVLDLFLQMLDEGVLRDKDNKEVSFKDAVIIATSNAAAAEIQKLIAEGKKLEDIEEEFVSNLILSGIFKPEFLNRFDEIVLFRPLTKEELLQVVDIIMASVNNNLARQKASVTLDDDAKRWLVEKGYDERLGARPLRRVVQRSVENIVAKKILESTFQPGDELHLTVQDLEQEVV
jgi:ATP-dependent Clp protease ATP-binding subunit ClpA